MVLSDPEVGDLDLDAGVLHVTKFDVGFPDVRRVSDPRPVANGTFDRSKYFAARSVAIEALVDGAANTRAVRDRLAPYFDPGRRPFLIYDMCDPSARRRLRLASDKFSGVYQGRPDTFQMQWVAPDGIIEDVTESTIRITPDSVSPGFWFPIEFPLTFPRGEGDGGPAYPFARNLGTIGAEWTAVIAGAVTSPMIELRETGEYLRFPGLNILDGSWVVIDSRAKTVMAGGTSNRISTLDFANSTWFKLRIGLNTLRMTAVAWGTNASCTVSWRNPYLI